MKYLKKFENKNQEPSITIAAKRGSLNNIKKIIKNNPEYINKKDSDGRTALMYAVLEKYIFIVDFLLKNGADVNLQDNDNVTALMMASTPKIIDKLLKYDIDVNIKDDNGRNVIMNWIQNHNPKLLKYLKIFINKGIDLSIKDKNGDNFYSLLMKYEDYNKDVIDFMDENYTQYGKKWRSVNRAKKYNLI